MKGGLEFRRTNLPRKDTTEHFDGEEKRERWEEIQRVWPGAMPACGEHAVDMRMMLQSLVPSMEHAERSRISAPEVTRIASDLQQSCSAAGVKQQVIDQPFYSAMASGSDFP